MSFDALYGDGSLEELRKLLVFSHHEQAEIGGGVRLVLGWGERVAKLDCFPERVYWQNLDTRATTPQGLYTLITDTTPGFFRARGVSHYGCAAKNDLARNILKSRGNWTDLPNGEMDWVL